MKIKSTDAVPANGKVHKGDKLFEFTINLKEIRDGYEGKDISQKLLNASKKMSNSFLASVYSAVGAHLQEVAHAADAQRYLSCLNSSDGCTFVWYACGSCQGSLALVEAFCPDGDHRWCERC